MLVQDIAVRSLSATDAAFAGFRILRDNPAIILMWTLVSFLFMLGVILLIAMFVGGPIVSLVQAGDADPAPEQVAALVLTMLPLILLMIPLFLIYSGVMVASVNRAILRPQEKGFFYLRLGADEMRVAVVLLVQGLAGFGVNMVASIVQTIATAGAMVAGGAESSAAFSPAAVAVQLASWAVMIFLNVKFCLAPAQTFAKRSIDIFGTWSLTKGRFWTIFAAYLLAGVICVLLGVVILVVLFGAAFASGIGAMLQAGAGLETLNIPLLVGFGVVAAIVLGFLGTLSNTLLYAVAPSVYRQITGEDDPSAVFA